ncbi:MAG: hypothetical protein KA257_02530 [Opitutaceae bacterium]|nr:hypothetical protein [Opitutaceae bacterium]
MKKIVIFILSLVCVALVGAADLNMKAYLDDGGLEASAIDNVYKLPVHLIIKNVGNRVIRFPTNDYGGSFSRDKGMGSLTLSFSKIALIDGYTEIVPEASFAPAELRPGEAVKIVRRITLVGDNIQSLNIKLIIDEHTAKRYGLWSGQLEATAVKERLPIK